MTNAEKSAAYKMLFFLRVKVSRSKKLKDILKLNLITIYRENWTM